ncbi:MCE family protein [bacterium]|nr:MAG: MCE family protein [bacterium]
MKRQTAMEVAVGLFVLVGLAVAMVFVLSIAERQHIFVKRVWLYATFDNVEGLRSGSPVFLSGVEAGAVNSLSFTEKGQVTVALRVQASYMDRIKSDSVATIGTVGLLGDKSIEISVGSPGALPVSVGGNLRTVPPLSINRLVEGFEPVKNRLEEVLRNLSEVTEQLAQDREAIGRTIKGAASAIDHLNSGEGTIGKLFKDERLYQDLIRTVSSSKEAAVAIEEVATRAIPLVEDIQTVASQLKASSRNFPEISESASRLLVSADEAAENLSTLARDMHEASAGLPQVMSDIGAAAENIREASEELPGTARSLRGTVEEGGRVMEAAKGNWLLKGSFPEEAPPEALEVDRR